MTKPSVAQSTVAVSSKSMSAITMTSIASHHRCCDYWCHHCGVVSHYWHCMAMAQSQ